MRIYFESIHTDATSISLTGEYKDQQESAINVAFAIQRIIDLI